jgi:hypothetical protein
VREIADEVWCAASAPVIQSLLVGLGVAAVGLAVFPFTARLIRPEGAQRRFREATTAVRLGRRISWLVAVTAALTLAGYVVVYVRARGKFCDAVLDPASRTIVVAWGATAVATFTLLAVLAALRHRTHRTD